MSLYFPREYFGSDYFPERYFDGAVAGGATYEDSATVYITITPSGVENAQFYDAATVYYDISVLSAEVFESADSATVYYDITVTSVQTVLSELFVTGYALRWLPTTIARWGEYHESRWTDEQTGRWLTAHTWITRWYDRMMPRRWRFGVTQRTSADDTDRSSDSHSQRNHTWLP